MEITEQKTVTQKLAQLKKNERRKKNQIESDGRNEKILFQQNEGEWNILQVLREECKLFDSTKKEEKMKGNRRRKNSGEFHGRVQNILEEERMFWKK